jgi:hypothetical protein
MSGAGSEAGRPGPGHVPAEQIRRQPAQICTEVSGEIGAVAVAHGAQIEIGVDPGGGAGTRPVTDRTPCGRGLDHGRWHGYSRTRCHINRWAGIVCAK